MVDKYVAYESLERLKKDFEAFEKQVLEKYNGNFYLSLERIVQMFEDEKASAYKVSGLLVYSEDNLIPIRDALFKLYNEKKKQEEYDRIMSEFIDEEGALELIREVVDDPENYFYDIAEVIAEGMDMRKEDHFYYYKTILSGEEIWKRMEELRKEIAKKLSRDEGEIEIGKALMSLIYGDMKYLAGELCQELKCNKKDVAVGFDDTGWNFRVYISRNLLTSKYSFNKNKAAEDMLSYLKRYHSIYAVLDDGFEGYIDTEEIYKKNLSHPVVEEIIRRLASEGKYLLENITADDLIPLIELPEPEEDDDESRGKNKKGRRR